MKKALHDLVVFLEFTISRLSFLKTGAKLSEINLIFVPILTYGHESWVKTVKAKLQMQASEMRFLRKIKVVTMFDKFITLRFKNLLTSSDRKISV